MKIVSIENIKFLSLNNNEYLDIFNKNGLFVFPAAPALINLFSDKEYKKSLENAYISCFSCDFPVNFL